MKKGLLSKGIPTILAIILLIAGVAGGYYLVKNQQLFGSKTSPQAVPQNVTISNVSSNGFTVSWVTAEPASGAVFYSETEKLDQKKFDSRDELTGDQKTYTSHYVNIDNLKSSTKYLFKISSGSEKSLFDNKGKPFEIATGPALGSQPANDIIYGKVVEATQKPASGTIIYINLANAAPISALVSNDGMWAKPLHSGRTTDLNSYVSYDAESSILTIKASLGFPSDKNAQIKVATKNDTPVPTIVLGKDQSYLEAKASPLPPEQLPATPQSESEATPAAIPVSLFSSITDLEATPSVSIIGDVSINNPARDGEQLNTSQPQILGKGPSGKMLTIKVESSQSYSGTVLIDSSGNWAYTPPANLTSGEHKVTVSWVDEEGKQQQIARQFVVLAAEESSLPAFEATPSASASPSPSPSPSAPPRVSMPSTEEGVPQPGSLAPTFFVFILGIGLFFSGFTLQFLSKKGSL